LASWTNNDPTPPAAASTSTVAPGSLATRSSERGEFGRVAHQVDESIDPVRVCFSYRVWQQDRHVVDRLGSSVCAHALGVGDADIAMTFAPAFTAN
jgi:hypothetical protein